jgi:hypothetical protein
MIYAIGEIGVKTQIAQKICAIISRHFWGTGFRFISLISLPSSEAPKI